MSKTAGATGTSYPAQPTPMGGCATWLRRHRLVQSKQRPKLAWALKCFAAGEMSHFGILVQSAVNVITENNEENKTVLNGAGGLHKDVVICPDFFVVVVVF